MLEVNMDDTENGEITNVMEKVLFGGDKVWYCVIERPVFELEL